jgi:hypothetical protein
MRDIDSLRVKTFAIKWLMIYQKLNKIICKFFLFSISYLSLIFNHLIIFKVILTYKLQFLIL